MLLLPLSPSNYIALGEVVKEDSVKYYSNPDDSSQSFKKENSCDEKSETESGPIAETGGQEESTQDAGIPIMDSEDAVQQRPTSPKIPKGEKGYCRQ
jgi:hypothetical protein